MDSTPKSNADESFIPTRTTLLHRIKDWQDEESWQVFYAMYRKMTLRIARKSGLDNHAAEEILQETMLAIATSIERFKYEPQTCSFKGWLLHMIRCRIADYYRKKECRIPSASWDLKPAQKENINADDQSVILPDKEWDKEWQQGLMDAALEKIRSKVSPRQFQIFDFYVIKEWPAKKVATTLNISMVQVYLAKYRVSNLLKKEILDLKEQWE